MGERQKARVANRSVLIFEFIAKRAAGPGSCPILSLVLKARTVDVRSKVKRCVEQRRPRTPTGVGSGVYILAVQSILIPVQVMTPTRIPQNQICARKENVGTGELVLIRWNGRRRLRKPLS